MVVLINFSIIKKILLDVKKFIINRFDYNIFLLDTKVQNKNKTLSLSLVILVSLIFGGVYVLISNAFQPHKMAKKTLTD